MGHDGWRESWLRTSTQAARTPPAGAVSVKGNLLLAWEVDLVEGSEAAAAGSGWMMSTPVPLQMTRRPPSPQERSREKGSTPDTLPTVKWKAEL